MLIVVLVVNLPFGYGNFMCDIVCVGKKISLGVKFNVVVYFGGSTVQVLHVVNNVIMCYEMYKGCA